MTNLSDRSQRQMGTPYEDTPEERVWMGRVSGALWTVGALGALVATFLPGAHHGPIAAILLVASVACLYGAGSAFGLIPWERLTVNFLAAAMAAMIPVVGAALYLTGGSLSYVEPLMICSLLYIGFYFPPRLAWPLTVELVLMAATPFAYDANAVDNAYPSRYLGLAVAFLAATWVMTGLKARLLGAERRQREIANRDALTGVGNRRSFDAQMEHELEARRPPLGGRREADGTPLALMILDLDDFKGVNDRYGHQVGDSVLREAAESALSILRATDTLARIGGDEFAVITPGARGEGAARMAEMIRAAVGAGQGRGLPTPGASVGWAVFPDDGGDFETLLRAADERMLATKRNDPRRDPPLPTIGSEGDTAAGRLAGGPPGAGY